MYLYMRYVKLKNSKYKTAMSTKKDLRKRPNKLLIKSAFIAAKSSFFFIKHFTK